jgi:S1-C subfamily serine protease
MRNMSNLTAFALLVCLAIGVLNEAAAQPKGKSGGYAANRGARLTYVVPGSPAADAGLEVDDVITYVNGVQVSSLTHLTNALAGKARVTLTVINCRDGSTIKVTAYPRAGKLGVEATIVETSPPPPIYSPGGP